MNCDTVKNKLPEYLAGECKGKEREEITLHLATCKSCMKELEELEKPLFKDSQVEALNSTLSKSVLLRARRKLLTTLSVKIIGIIIVIAIIFLVVIPVILSSIRMTQLSNYSRALGDVIQFSIPTNVGGYGNSFKGSSPYSTKVKIYTSNETGTKAKELQDYEAELNFITGNLTYKTYTLPKFIHPNTMPEKSALKAMSPEIAEKILIKNSDNTVSRVSISLTRVMKLNEVVDLLNNYDIHVLWMAIECGKEKLKAKNMTAGQNQYYEWGIPGKLFNRASGMSFVNLNKDNSSEYLKSVMEEMKWLDKNKSYVKRDPGLYKDNNIDNGVSTKANYVIKNGIKIYGLQLTGPTSELLKLQKALPIRTEGVEDIDFWYWK